MTVKAGPSNPNRSITDVAARAQVSTATVSRVLTGRRKNDDDIARRVRQAAEELKYSVNYAASALRSDITNTVAVVVPNLTDAFTSGLLGELEGQTSDMHKQLMLGIGGDAETQSRRIERLISRRADGLVIVPAKGANLTAPIDEFGDMVPIVQIAGDPLSYHTNWVGVDERASMELVLTHLSERNANAIAYFSGAVDSNGSAELFVTFQTLANLFNLFTQPEWTTFGECAMRRGYDDAMRLFGARGERPDAVICADDAVAIGVLLALRQLGIDVPSDVKVVGSGDSQAAAAIDPALTSVRPPYQRMVKEALRLIELGKTGQHWLPAHVALSPQLVERESTQAPRIGTSDMAAPSDKGSA